MVSFVKEDGLLSVTNQHLIDATNPIRLDLVESFFTEIRKHETEEITILLCRNKQTPYDGWTHQYWVLVKTPYHDFWTTVEGEKQLQWCIMRFWSMVNKIRKGMRLNICEA